MLQGGCRVGWLAVVLVEMAAGVGLGTAAATWAGWPWSWVERGGRAGLGAVVAG